ncbi:MAG TPA: hypothetical protein VKT77_03755 [Chthonomonadaceae bacterium]|nr:hypothetical protein [Chthonomonadaceae bacterium]
MDSSQQSVLDRPDDIVRAIERLDNPDLDTVVERALRIRAERNAPHLSARETELFSQINQVADEATWDRYRDLRSRRESPDFTRQDLEELTNLYDTIELQHARRIRAVIELAQIRKLPVEELMDRLGLVSPGCE